jgi:hypothetical protein
MRAKVERYEQIRREYEHAGERFEGSPRSWGLIGVREAALGAVPVERKTPMRIN